MEESKGRVGIREWGITQTSLEEVRCSTVPEHDTHPAFNLALLVGGAHSYPPTCLAAYRCSSRSWSGQMRLWCQWRRLPTCRGTLEPLRPGRRACTPSPQA
jgi:hypothetical protein